MKLNSPPKLFNVLVITIGGLLFCSIAVYFLYLWYQDDFLLCSNVIVPFAICGGIGFPCIACLPLIPGYQIREKTLFKRTLFGKERKLLEINEIQSWWEEERQEKNKSSYLLYLQAENHSVELDSRNFKSRTYLAFRKILTTKKPQKKVTRFKTYRQEFRARIGIFAFCILFCCWWGISEFQASQQSFSKEDYQEIQGVINHLEAVVWQTRQRRSRRKRKHCKLELSLTDYPGYLFFTRDNYWDAQYFAKYHQPGDSIVIHISKEEYQQKISEELPIASKHKCEPTQSRIMGLSISPYTYLHLEKEFQQENTSSKAGLVAASVIGFLLLLLVGYLVFLNYQEGKEK